MVVGAYYETVSGKADAGHAYIFNATTGTLISTLTSPNPQPTGEFGYSVAVSGNTVVVGAVGETASGEAFAGHAYIFNATAGTLISTLTSPNPQPTGEFGYSVAVSGNTVVVGAAYETASGQVAAGHAYTFNAATGALISTLTSPNPQLTGEFGYSVACSDSVVVVGAHFETANGQTDAGHAYIFNATTDTLVSTLTSPNAQYEGFFGTSVAASNSVVVVGAYYENASGRADAGHAYTFNAATGALISTLTSPNVQYDGQFGYSVAASGSVVVVGAYIETAGGQAAAGHAYTFNAATGALISTLTSPNVQYDGQFGYSVAVSGNVVVVGAWYEAAGGYTSAGHAYIF